MKRALGFGVVLLAAGVGMRCAWAAGLVQPDGAVALYFLGSGAPAGGAGGGHGAPGYLGVDVRDVVEDQMGALKLKEAHGAEITLVDHDAPAGKAGLREHDVVLQMNGQAILGEEPLRRMLRESPPGRAVVLLISRDGQQMTVTAQMANREEVERRAWEQHITVPEPQGTPAPQSAASAPAPAVGGSGPAVHAGNSFLGTILMSPAYTGAMLEPMSAQLAQFFGVPGGGGLLVRSVADNSPAAQAGMHAGDVVVRANAQRVATTSEWSKAIKNSRGRSLTVVVLRGKVEQTLTLTPDGKRRSSVEEPGQQTPPSVMARLGLSWMPRL